MSSAVCQFFVLQQVVLDTFWQRVVYKQFFLRSIFVNEIYIYTLSKWRSTHHLGWKIAIVRKQFIGSRLFFDRLTPQSENFEMTLTLSSLLSSRIAKTWFCKIWRDSHIYRAISQAQIWYIFLQIIVFSLVSIVESLAFIAVSSSAMIQVLLLCGCSTFKGNACLKMSSSFAPILLRRPFQQGV